MKNQEKNCDKEKEPWGSLVLVTDPVITLSCVRLGYLLIIL